MTKRVFVLINTAQGKAKEVSDLIEQRNGVVSAHTVTGLYDVIAVLEAEDFTEMGDIVTSKIARIRGVNSWTVCAEHH
jgi:DNA-binding Lrp family transcriptional regulator